MINGKKICAVLPAYNAAKTLRRTLNSLDRSLVDQVILVDDNSTDETQTLARELGIDYAFHRDNHGYGGNQKTCYALALASGADIVVMLHPDYQYEPKLLPALAHMIASGVYDVAIASRILGHGALNGGMPVYKYVFNRALTFAQNILTGQKLSEYHTGYRAFSRQVLETLPLLANSDDFVFDNEMLVQCHARRFRIAEISCPTKYFEEASSISFKRSVRYGLGVLRVSLAYRAYKWRLAAPRFLDESGEPAARLQLGFVGRRIGQTNLRLPESV
ncbi:glycosyltransferase family 2 protein [Nibricoccus sp. IMCC34717]|uniref:glycosyltransferase family 2 protein n=1 Tax=Nibricoccus sp. IMCC34717 TaxID=3034021 RepID=UPI003850F2CC